MKNPGIIKSLLTVILAFTCLSMAGCDKDDNDIDGNYHMTAKIDGSSWSSAAGQLVATTIDEYLFISGATNDENELITINFFNFPGNTGTYPMGTGEYDFHCFYSYGDTSWFVFEDEPQTTGILVITDFSSESIKGTFSFTGLNNEGDSTVTVTEGSFYMPIHHN